MYYIEFLNFLTAPGAPGAAPGAGEQPAASKTGKYIAPGLREGAANRRGESMPRSQRGAYPTKYPRVH